MPRKRTSIPTGEVIIDAFFSEPLLQGVLARLSTEERQCVAESLARALHFGDSLDRPALVGRTAFGVGTGSRQVIECAQHAYDLSSRCSLDPQALARLHALTGSPLSLSVSDAMVSNFSLAYSRHPAGAQAGSITLSPEACRAGLQAAFDVIELHGGLHAGTDKARVAEDSDR